MANEPTAGMPAANDLTDTFAPPRADVEHKRDPRLAGPWRRWLARNIDIIWEMAVVGLALGAVIAVTSSTTITRALTSQGGSLLFASGMMIVGLLLDAGVHHLFGNTPGKALLGVRVLSRDRVPLSFGGHVKRNMRVWFSGYALAIPIASFFTMAFQHARVKSGQGASYDASARRRVEAEPIGAARAVFAIVVYLAMISIYTRYIVGGMK